MKKDRSSLKLVWSIVIVFIYLCIAAIFAFAPIFSEESWIMRMLMSGLLFLYGLFRAYRVWKML